MCEFFFVSLCDRVVDDRVTYYVYLRACEVLQENSPDKMKKKKDEKISFRAFLFRAQCNRIDGVLLVVSVNRIHIIMILKWATTNRLRSQDKKNSAQDYFLDVHASFSWARCAVVCSVRILFLQDFYGILIIFYDFISKYNARKLYAFLLFVVRRKRRNATIS